MIKIFPDRERAKSIFGMVMSREKFIKDLEKIKAYSTIIAENYYEIIKKTMCHPHLKVWVCDRHLFLGCSEMKTVKSTTTS